MNPFRIFMTLLTVLPMLAGSTGCGWHHKHHGTHHGPHRAGLIWSVAENKYISESAFIDAASRSDFILLGERHDHPRHHILQARILKALVDAGKQPAVAFEMLAGEKQSAVDERQASFPRAMTGYADAVSWSQSGWPKWDLYAPVFEVAIQNGLPILAADIPIKLRKDIHANSNTAMPTEWMQRFKLSEPLPAQLEKDLRNEIEKSHCGYADAAMVDSLTQFQRLRDAYLADRLLSAGRQTVLIAGNGHARKDRGVPLYLRAVAPEKQVVTLSFIEADDAKTQKRKISENRAASDYIWFTEALDTDDPCVVFKKRLEKMRKP